MYSKHLQHSSTTKMEVSPHCVDYSLSECKIESWSLCVRGEQNGELTKIIQIRQSLSWNYSPTDCELGPAYL